MVAYAFARLRGPLHDILCGVVLATLMLPVLVVLLAFQRYFIEGITITGMGGS